MTADIVPETSARFARMLGPETDDVIDEMDDQAAAEGFPTVGPEVGGWLQLLARLVDARRVFEFGSGFGYSAYWFARALPDDGEVVLTEVDQDELDQAREYMARGGFDDLASYELGDAIETIDEYDGPFDVVLIDNEKDRYREAFESVREKVAPGGVVVADNAMTAGPIDFDALSTLVEGDEPIGDVNAQTQGVYEYLEAVRGDPAFETGVIPLGEGIAVSHRTA
ncbi:O-methyltransferase [Halorientalis brevis]|uniref:O-methyltransferase n=1 Tax=Halorientalis brevis TaxID=1126241 RepID=A0ABD6CBY1_9EURY|nr:O-methyltransferase [Halorientalis brevis]